jgi:3-isopropylmalate/(R)-2-methylmalate dehydratase small subunit
MTRPGVEITVDLEKQLISVAGSGTLSFSIDPFFRECLLNGWDEIALTLREEGAIAAFEARRASRLPLTS